MSRQQRAQWNSSSLRRVSSHVGADNKASSSFSEPGRMPRRWANRARDPAKPHFDDRQDLATTDARPASAMSPSEQIFFFY